jgi:transposase InsO family protein
MVAALASRELGRQVNRKRTQRIMREQRLLQRHRPLRRWRRPGFFRIERPDQLWHLDMTSVWVGEHGWAYLNAAIDCCTREIVGWSLELRCRTEEASALVDRAVAQRGIELVWRSEFETLDQARKEIAAYMDNYHHRPHSGLGYRTPTEARRTWEDGQRPQKTAD